MKKKEIRKITITYCDYCKEEIKGNYHTLHKEDKTELHFCKIVKEGNKNTCLVNYKKEQWNSKKTFDCYLCGNTFNRVGEPKIHYDENDNNEEIVSLCDNCTEITYEKLNNKNITVDEICEL